MNVSWKEVRDSTPGSAKRSGALQCRLPRRFKLGVIGLQNRSLGHQNITTVSKLGNRFLKESPHPTLGAVAGYGTSYLLSGDECDAQTGLTPIEENEPGGMPYFIRFFVDAIEVTLSGDTGNQL